MSILQTLRNILFPNDKEYIGELFCYQLIFDRVELDYWIIQKLKKTLSVDVPDNVVYNLALPFYNPTLINHVKITDGDWEYNGDLCFNDEGREGRLAVSRKYIR